MGKRDLFWDQVPSDADGQIQWPEDPHLREDLVRAAFGAKVIGALESVLEDHLEVARGDKRRLVLTSTSARPLAVKSLRQ